MQADRVCSQPACTLIIDEKIKDKCKEGELASQMGFSSLRRMDSYTLSIFAGESISKRGTKQFILSNLEAKKGKRRD